MSDKLAKFCSIFLLLVSQYGISALASDLPVFSVSNKLLVTEVPADSDYAVVAESDVWQTVQFSQPTVPVWVSARFVKIEGDEATITADSLRLRVGPSLDAKILALAARGHRSVILGRSDDFLQIYAPASISFAIRKVKPVDSAESPQVVSDLLPEAQSPTLSPQTQLETAVEAAPASVDKQQPAVVQPVTEAAASRASNPAQPSPRLPDAAGAGKSAGDTTAASIDPSTDLVPVHNEATAIAQQHRLSPGDTISLQVFGEKDLNISKVRIPESGRVSFPLIGSVAVANKSLKEVENTIRTSLAQGYIKDPKLSVTIDSYRPIFVKGAIASTGAFPYTEGLTITKALALAGGTRNSAKKNGVSVSRDGAIVQSGLAIDSEYRILSGDIITVEEEYGVGEESALYVYLHGEVNRPGEYQFRRGLTVEKAVVLAGGFTVRASRKKISVSRIVEGEEVPVKLKKVPLYLPVEPGDIIDIGASWF